MTEAAETKTKGKEGRKDSIGYKEAMVKNKPLLDSRGGQIYKPIPVDKKRGMLFCTHCHDYRKFIKRKNSFDIFYKGCEECGISTNDFDVKTANSLWEKIKKERRGKNND